MAKALIRLLAFFGKEINEVRRQPRLVLSLLLGPFLILLLFGLGYQAKPPRPRLALVIPDALAQQVDVKTIRDAANLTFEVASVAGDENEAMQQLRGGAVDVVEIVPADVRERLERGESAPIEFRYSEVNPLNESWVQSLGYAQVNEMNKLLLLQSTAQMQQEARSNQEWVTAARQELDSLAGANPNELAQRQATIRRLHALVAAAAASAVLSQAASNGENPETVRQELNALAADLDALDQSITNNSLAQEQSHLDAARQRLARLENVLKTFANMPAQVVVSPLLPTYENLAGQALTLAKFYAPAVLALILQHIAVTLAALSLVRERLLGAIELFRVAPVSRRQVLLGKYLAFALFTAIIAAVLTFAMFAMQVPFRGDVSAFVGIIMLLIVAGLGVGLLISTISKTETQAIQLSMLVLLLSIFFGGFFLPLENFWLPVRVIGYLLPLTPSIMGLQDIMLRGDNPDLFIWLLLGGSALITFLLVNVWASRQLRFAQN